GADSGAPGFAPGLARDPGGDLLPVAHLDVEADAPASEGGATDPGAGVRNAEVCARIARGTGFVRGRRWVRSGRFRRDHPMGCPGACASEPRLLSASEHELGRTHRAT